MNTNLSMKKIFFTLSLGLLSFFAFSSPPHPYHVSSAKLSLSIKTSEWKLSKKVFTEDLELALSAINDTSVRLDLMNEKNHTLLEEYVNSKIQIFKISGKPVDYEILGYTYSPESINIEIRFKCGRRFEIHDEFLFDLFKDHKNIYAIRKDPQKGFNQHEVTTANSTIFTVL
tara:strand:- start:837 stop:1352 length:516 start_codon:yes stop_codon:yes gene_type:complete